MTDIAREIHGLIDEDLIDILRYFSDFITPEGQEMLWNEAERRGLLEEVRRGDGRPGDSSRVSERPRATHLHLRVVGGQGSHAG